MVTRYMVFIDDLYGNYGIEYRRSSAWRTFQVESYYRKICLISKIHLMAVF